MTSRASWGPRPEVTANETFFFNRGKTNDSVIKQSTQLSSGLFHRRTLARFQTLRHRVTVAVKVYNTAMVVDQDLISTTICYTPSVNRQQLPVPTDRSECKKKSTDVSNDTKVYFYPNWLLIKPFILLLR